MHSEMGFNWHDVSFTWHSVFQKWKKRTLSNSDICSTDMLKETDYCWIHVPWFQQKWKTSCSAQWLRLFLRAENENRCVFCVNSFLLCSIIPNLWLKRKLKWWHDDAGITQKLVLRQKVPYISKSLRLDDPRKFDLKNKKKEVQECDMTNLCSDLGESCSKL